MGKEIAKQWMTEIFLPTVESDSILIIDAWNGYKEMKEIPAGSTAEIQPADVFFNRTFKHFIRRMSDKIRWRYPNYILLRINPAKLIKYPRPCV